MGTNSNTIARHKIVIMPKTSPVTLPTSKPDSKVANTNTLANSQSLLITPMLHAMDHLPPEHRPPVLMLLIILTLCQVSAKLVVNLPLLSLLLQQKKIAMSWSTIILQKLVLMKLN